MSLEQSCQAIGFNFRNLPAGATAISSNGDGTVTITVNGQNYKYNTDGSLFTASAQSSGAAVDDERSVFTGNGGYVNVGAGYNPATFMNTNIDALLSQVGLNFDFSQFNTAGGAAGTVPGQVPGVPMTGTVLRGNVEVTDESGNKTTIKKLAKDAGYGTSSVDGVFVKKDSDDKIRYYKYDKDTGSFVECNKNGADITDEQRMLEEEKAKEEAAAAEKAKKQKAARAEASGIAGDMYSAMKGWGTDDSKLNSAVNQTNKDNVLEVLEVYQNNHSENMDGETLIQSIQSDMSGKEEAAVINKIADALCERARELGLDEEANALRATLDAEFKPQASWGGFFRGLGKSILGSGAGSIAGFPIIGGVVSLVRDGYHAVKGTPDAVHADDDVVNNAIMKLANQIKAKEMGVEYVPPQPAAEE